MQEAKKISVNVVAWNSMAYLPNLFASLDLQDSREFTVTVVDNASDDGTPKWLQAHPEVAVLRNFRNQGFARAHNQAIALALTRWSEDLWPHRYILIANPDLEFAPSSVRLLAAAMDADPAIAAAGPKLLRAHVSSVSDDGHRETERTNIIDAAGLVVKKSRRAYDRGAGEEDKGQYDAPGDVFGFSGACVMFRAKALADARLAGEFFDEDFFAYKEDVDLAWRMKRLAMRARYVPQAVVWHHRGTPSRPHTGLFATAAVRASKPAYVNFLSTRNHVWLGWKNDETLNQLIHLPWIAPYEIGKCLATLASWSAFKGYCAALAGIGNMWKKQQELARRAKVSGAAMRKWFV